MRCFCFLRPWLGFFKETNDILYSWLAFLYVFACITSAAICLPFSWVAPANGVEEVKGTFIAPITNYTVYCSSNPDCSPTGIPYPTNVCAPVGATPECTLSGLTPGCAYAVRVEAIDSYGNTASSSVGDPFNTTG